MTQREKALQMNEVAFDAITGAPVELHKLSIDGKCPTGREAKRILCQPAAPVEKCAATAPLHQKGFSFLR
jgi:hypothetical protein